MNSNSRKYYLVFGKRFFDILLSSLGLIIALPFCLVISFLVMAFISPSVFFIQKRVGKDNRVFNIIKFRTMSNQKSFSGELLPDEERLNRFGKFLRKSSLDELPELWNILRGDMSFVGPRPLLVEYLPLYNKYQLKRHDVLPGLTGLAQVKGRNAIDWESKFNLDIQYVENISFGSDLRILLKTIVAVLSSRGVSAVGEATMSKFTGSDHSKE